MPDESSHDRVSAFIRGAKMEIKGIRMRVVCARCAYPIIVDTEAVTLEDAKREAAEVLLGTSKRYRPQHQPVWYIANEAAICGYCACELVIEEANEGE